MTAFVGTAGVVRRSVRKGTDERTDVAVNVAIELRSPSVDAKGMDLSMLSWEANQPQIFKRSMSADMPSPFRAIGSTEQPQLLTAPTPSTMHLDWIKTRYEASHAAQQQVAYQHVPALPTNESASSRHLDWIKEKQKHLASLSSPKFVQSSFDPTTLPSYSAKMEQMKAKAEARRNAVKAPEPVVVKAPEPVVVKAPEPVVAKKPEPVVAKKPEPVVAKKPEPVVAKEPEPVVAKEAKPVQKSDIDLAPKKKSKKTVVAKESKPAKKTVVAKAPEPVAEPAVAEKPETVLADKPKRRSKKTTAKSEPTRQPKVAEKKERELVMAASTEKKTDSLTEAWKVGFLSSVVIATAVVVHTGTSMLPF